MADQNNHYESSIKPPHIAILSFPFASHPIPLVTLTRRLAAAAPDATFSFFGTAISNALIFTESSVNLHNLKAYQVEDGVPEKYVFKGKKQEDIDLFMKAAPENINKALQVAIANNNKKITCLMSDAFLWFGGEIAEEMGVPWVPVSLGGACSLSTHVYTDLIRNKIGLDPDGIARRKDESIKFIPGMSALPVGELQDGILLGNLDSVFSRMLHRMGQVLPYATAVVVNSFEELEPTVVHDLKSKFKKCLTLAPFTFMSPPQSVLDTTGCLSWLDKQKPASVAYISFGTAATPPPHELAALAQGLEASGTPFLWSLKDRLKVQLPEGFLERMSTKGMIVPWAPQLRVLDHSAIGVFVTHGGWNSVLESLMAGVPMICRPFFGDHPVNVRFVSDVWKIGLRIEHGVFTKDGIISSLDLILSKEKGREIREKVQSLKQLTEMAIGTKGSSTQNFNTLLQIVSST